MNDILFEAEYLYYTLASVATLLVIAAGWKALSGKERQEKRQREGKEASQDDRTDTPTNDVDDLLIDASEIKAIEPKIVKKPSGDQSPGSPEGKIVRMRAKHLEEELKKDMTADQIDEERKVREQQLAAIYKLMQTNEEKFGVDSMEDVKSQYELYTK